MDYSIYIYIYIFFFQDFMLNIVLFLLSEFNNLFSKLVMYIHFFKKYTSLIHFFFTQKKNSLFKKKNVTLYIKLF